MESIMRLAPIATSYPRILSAAETVIPFGPTPMPITDTVRFF